MATILIVERESRVRESLAGALEPLGHTIQAISSPEAAFAALRKGAPDVLVAEAESSGLDLMEQLRGQDAKTGFVITTTLPRKDTALAAMRAGAADVLVKPFATTDAVEAVKRALALREGRFEEAFAHESKGPSSLFLATVGTSAAAGEIRTKFEELTEKDNWTLLLLTGPKGVGKYEISRVLHQARTDTDGRLVSVDCAKMRADAVRLWLGQQSTGPGKAFVEARGGTIFIEQAEALPESLEEELADAGTQLDDGTRIIIATRLNRTELAKSGGFSPALLAVMKKRHINLPALKERKEDIPAMVETILEKSALLEDSDRTKTFSDKAMKALCKRDYPENTEELERVVVKSVRASDAAIVEAVAE